jgi:hypothetical protein
MKSLTFGFGGTASGSNFVRSGRFEERSSLPVSAACVVASGIRETLVSILSLPIGVRLLEPVIPSPHAWEAISTGAAFYRFHGSVVDAAIVLRPDDAAALAAAAFGERSSDSRRELSPLERDVLERTVAAIAGTLTAICGARERDGLERAEHISGFEAYFEIALEHSLDARIGIALSRDLVPEPHGRLELTDLGDVLLEPAVRVDLQDIEAGALPRLAVGDVLQVPAAKPFRGQLQLAGRTLARGTCGVCSDRYALTIEALP